MTGIFNISFLNTCTFQYTLLTPYSIVCFQGCCQGMSAEKERLCEVFRKQGGCPWEPEQDIDRRVKGSQRIILSERRLGPSGKTFPKTTIQDCHTTVNDGVCFKNCRWNFLISGLRKGWKFLWLCVWSPMLWINWSTERGRCEAKKHLLAHSTDLPYIPWKRLGTVPKCFMGGI